MKTIIRNNKKQLIISSIIILLPIVAGVLLWDYLPEQIATHFGIDNEPDSWQAKSFVVFGIPLILLVFHWVCVLVTALDPKNKGQSSKVFHMVLWLLPVMSLLLCGLTYTIALGNEMNIGFLARAFVGLMFLIVGNYMPKCKQNHTIGIKITWTLRNEENWNKTHRFAGRIWVIGGLLLLVTLFVPTENFTAVFFVLIVMMVSTPIVYSYVYYRKQLKKQISAKEDSVNGKN
ncbi:MAG: SdpI family protein [Blautia sp.]|nr:SdpI family protein [Lachnoclostridium sp.]MCM1211440.1 SdpI family protein [Blautia sp.]